MSGPFELLQNVLVVAPNERLRLGDRRSLSIDDDPVHPEFLGLLRHFDVALHLRRLARGREPVHDVDRVGAANLRGKPTEAIQQDRQIVQRLERR